MICLLKKLASMLGYELRKKGDMYRPHAQSADQEMSCDPYRVFGNVLSDIPADAEVHSACVVMVYANKDKTEATGVADIDSISNLGSRVMMDLLLRQAARAKRSAEAEPWEGH